MDMTINTCAPSNAMGRERTRFFPRQLVTPDDLTQDQLYFREKMRRHNRMLHGWGVVCGARVKAGTAPCQIVVEPGYILGPYGDEIMIDSEVTVDLCNNALDGNAVSPCADVLNDPWCSEVPVSRPAGQTLYVAIRYEECQTRPVRAVVSACGCDAASCEYSRIRDSYAIRVLTTLPSTYSDPMPQPEFILQSQCAANTGCPACPTDPWVILADVTLKGDTTIDTIDCFAHRRFVVSFADYYYLCHQKTTLLSLQGLRILTIDPNGREQMLLDVKNPPSTPAGQLPGFNSVPTPLIFEAQFNEAVKSDTVIARQTFLVTQGAAGGPTTNLPGAITPAPPGADPQKVFRLTLKEPSPQGTYRVTLVGDGSPAITTPAGNRLDGDPGKPQPLPSGDGKEGGNFTFEFQINTQLIG